MENNFSGDSRDIRSEAKLRRVVQKYDGEPFMPHHIVEAVKNN
jgi:hypothetical protein